VSNCSKIQLENVFGKFYWKKKMAKTFLPLSPTLGLSAQLLPRAPFSSWAEAQPTRQRLFPLLLSLCG
jgi:hypothetical protein